MLAVLFGGLVYALADDRQPVPYPESRRKPVVEERFGLTVEDPYRWMEGADPADSEAFGRWLKDQDAHTETVLDRLPKLAELRRRVSEAAHVGDVVRNIKRGGGADFFLRRSRKASSFTLWRLNSTGAAVVLFDPAKPKVDAKAIVAFEPSPDGKYLAVVASRGGTQGPVAYLLSGESGEFLEHLPAAPAEMTWLANSLLLGMADGTWRRHVVNGRSADDTIVFAAGTAGAPKIAEDTTVSMRVDPTATMVVAMVSGLADATPAVFVANRAEVERGTHTWRRIAAPADEIEDAVPHGEAVYGLATKGDAGRHVVELRYAGDVVTAKTVIPPTPHVLVSIAAASDGLYVRALEATHHTLRRFDWASWRSQRVGLPFDGSIRGPITCPAQPGALVGLESWHLSTTWYRVDGGSVEKTPVAQPMDRQPRDLVVQMEYAKSADGARIPISLVQHKTSKTDRPRPVWLMAYGAYGIAQTPRYVGGLLPFLEDGGVYAVAHVRGGGEFGPAWHRAGQAERKPNTYLDLIACAERLIAAGIGAAELLAIEGASGGGPVVGMAAMTRPDLFRVVFNRVGDNNTLRLFATPDGPAMAGEWGSPDIEAGFRSLLAMDVTQHVKPDVRYPAFFLATAGRDTSVPPWMPGKLTAHLQRVAVADRPVLLRVDHDGGHIAAPDVAEAQLAEMLAFLYWQIGKPEHQPRSK